MVEFAKNLADFAAATGKKHAVVLSSLDFGRCRNIDMSRYNSIHAIFFFSSKTSMKSIIMLLLSSW